MPFMDFLLARMKNRRPGGSLRSALPWLLLAILVPAPARAADDDIRLSTIGYLPDRPKVASIIGTAGTGFAIKRVSDDSTVLSGDLSSAITDADTSQTVRYADFSSVTEPGTYYLDIADVGRSLEFPIDRDVFGRQLTTVMLGYYGWRSGMAVEFEHQGQVFRQGPGHLQDGLLDYIGQPGVQRDGSHGWYDAGDYGKYTVNGAFALGMMLQAWESFGSRLQNLVLTIPEQGGTLPDFLDEMKWEYDWLFTMQYSPSDPRVSHKLTSLEFPAFIMPEDDTNITYYTAYGSAATADFVAAMAFGARVYRPYDSDLADRMLAVASSSYQWLQANTANVPADISAFTTGAYQTQDSDDRLWAAAEMWETTGDAAALADFEARASIADSKGKLFDVEFDWGNLRNLGIYTYLLSSRGGKDETLVSNLRAPLLQSADAFVSNRGTSGYGRAIASYYWGINGTVARICMTLQVANQLSPNPAYLDTCADQIAYLYGRNYYNRSFVTGAGKDPPLNPHHRPSYADGVTPPFPGLLVGGPWPQATSWQDIRDDYKTNEVAINWNGALVYALAGYLPGPLSGTGGASPSAELDSGAGTSPVVNDGSSLQGGGCHCRTRGGANRSSAWSVLLGLIAMLATRRRFAACRR